MLADADREVDMVGWVERAVAAKNARQAGGQPVSSSAPEMQQGHGEATVASNGTTPAGAPVPSVPAAASIAASTQDSAASNGIALSDAKPAEEVPAGSTA